MLLNEFLEQSARRYPDKTALITKNGRYSYREIDEMANRIANALISGGLEKGERAAVFMDNSLEAVVSIFGILKAGGIFLMVNPTTKARKLAYILGNCGAAVILSSTQKLAVVSETAGGIKSLKGIYLSGKDLPLNGISKNTVSFDEILTKGESSRPPCRSIDVDLASIIYTSGSTGVPKGVMMTHFSMVSAANSITHYLENRADDVILNVLPLSFDYGLYQVLMGFKTGATVILEKAFLYPSSATDIIQKERVTGFPIVPTISAILLQMEDMKKKSFDSLRYISSTGAVLPLAHIAGLRQLFPKARIYSMYGLTECKRISYLPPEQLDIRPMSVGKGMPNEEVYIVDQDGNRVGPGVVGELVVRGAHIMKGYWGMPEATAKRLKPGPYPGEMVLHTGDLFKMDEEGYLYFVSRTDDIIKCRGEKVSPREIEEVLCRIPGVAEASVIGVPDPVLGQAAKAFIVTSSGISLSSNDVLQFCSLNLEDYMIPKYVEFRDKFQKSENGKIDKEGLK